tara:strand:+ start:148 stop:909 length:762 start_codon:yes stop_codon:yes gene_type:complete
MKISVIIPFHKDIIKLKNSFISVKNQKKCNDFEIEVIIGNDSNYTDKEIKVFLSKGEDNNLIIAKNNKRKGPGNARNAAIEKSTGDLISFLDADDEWMENKIYMQFKKIREGFNFISTNYFYIPSLKKVISPKYISNFKDLFFKGPIGTSTILISRELLGKTRFNNMYFCQDLVLWTELAKKNNFRYSNLNNPLVKYSLEGRTSKNNYFKRAYYYFLACKKANLNLFESILAIIFYGIKGILNRTMASINIKI